MASFYDPSDVSFSKIFGISVSIITVIIIPPLLLLIIWFEKKIANNTTLINHFGVAVCTCSLFYIPILVFEIGLGLFGPCSYPFICHLYVMMKNVLILQFTAQFAAISIAKYKYIFVHKNPIGQHDNFWCFFFNLNIGILNLITQFVYQMLPRKKPYLYYFCCNENPLPTEHRIMNYYYQFFFIATIVIYVIVECKAIFFKQKDLVVPFTIENNNSNWLAKNLRSNIADGLILTLFVLIMTPFFALSVILNGTEHEKLFISPYYDLVHVHIHLIPLVCLCLLTGTFYVKNGKLRQTVYREVKSWINQFVD